MIVLVILYERFYGGYQILCSFMRQIMAKLLLMAILITICANVNSQQSGCMFDTCVVISDFCQNGGTCFHNSTDCNTSCDCINGFTGRRCEHDNLLQPDKELDFLALNCPTNPCSEQLATTSCRNGGSCSLNVVTCDFTCLCADGYTGRNCEQQNRSNTSDTKCRSNSLHCVHGVCNSNVTGSDNAIQKERCICENGWKGIRCDSKVIYSDTNYEDELNDIISNSSIQTTIEPRFNSCSTDYFKRSKNERTCDGMFWGHECVYGSCQKEMIQDETWVGYTYTCDCDYGAQGIYCSYKCCLNCGEHGTCAIVEHPNSTVSEFCDCKPNYEGQWCEIYVPEPVKIQLKENTWYLYVVGACAVTFIILIIMAVGIPYWMWKHRVILIMKIVYYFKPYEDDDDRQWDAFVSYKADEVDESFVVHTLYPKLEQELGYKLCLHFRDFVPGETIANNIINAVEGSRRTILILTPRYVESEFTRFEYEKAQQEMLRCKHRIIPLVLEDISGIASNMDKTLKNIIESVTYLEWPETNNEPNKKMEKFWKRLHLSMPKKKDSLKSAYSGNRSSFSTSNNQVLSSNFSSSSKDNKDETMRAYSHNALNNYKESHSSTPISFISSNTYNRTYSSSGESEDTVYTEISEIDISLDELIPTLSEEQEAALSIC